MPRAAPQTSRATTKAGKGAKGTKRGPTAAQQPLPDHVAPSAASTPPEQGGAEEQQAGEEVEKEVKEEEEKEKKVKAEEIKEEVEGEKEEDKVEEEKKDAHYSAGKCKWNACWLVAYYLFWVTVVVVGAPLAIAATLKMLKGPKLVLSVTPYDLL